MLKRRFRPGDRVVVESPIYRLGHNDHTRDAFNTDNSLGREGTVAYPSRDYAGNVRVHLDEVGYTLAFHPKGLLHVDDLPTLAAERAPEPAPLTDGRFTVGDEVVIESPIFSSTVHGIYHYADGTDLVGRRGNVRGFDEHDGDVLVDVGSFERDEWLVHPDGLLLHSELDELAASRAPAYSRGDRVEVVRSEYLWNGIVETHPLSDAPKVGDIVTVCDDGIVAGNLTVGDDVDADGGFLLDPAAVRPAPADVTVEITVDTSGFGTAMHEATEALADWERELLAEAARPKPGDLVELVEPGRVPWTSRSGQAASMIAAFGTAPVIEADPWHPDNIVVNINGPVRVLASAVRVVPAPVEEAAPAFKVGDRVRVTGDSAEWHHAFAVGTEGRVVEVNRRDPGNYRPGPDGCLVQTDRGALWDVAETDLEAVVPTPVSDPWESVREGWKASATPVEEPAPTSSKCSADCWLCNPTAEVEWKGATPRSSAASDEALETLRGILAPKPAPRTWSHRDDAGDLVKVSAEATYVEIELSGTYAVTRDEIEGDVATAELSPVAARQLAASIVAAADAVSPPSSRIVEDYSIPRGWIVGSPAPTFGIPEISLTERIAAYYR